MSEADPYIGRILIRTVQPATAGSPESQKRELLKMSSLLTSGKDESEKLLKSLVKYLIRNLSRDQRKNFIDSQFINSANKMNKTQLLLTAAKMNVRNRPLETIRLTGSGFRNEI